MTPIVLSGDVGGTNTRLQLTRNLLENATVVVQNEVSGCSTPATNSAASPTFAAGGSGTLNRVMSHPHNVAPKYVEQIKVVFQKKYSAADYPSLQEIIEVFMEESGVPKSDVKACCIAVAGPVKNGAIEFTNLPWALHEADLAEFFSIERARCKLINDFVSIGWGIETLDPARDLITLQDPYDWTSQTVDANVGHPDARLRNVQSPSSTSNAGRENIMMYPSNNNVAGSKHTNFEKAKKCSPFGKNAPDNIFDFPIATVGAGTGLGFGFVHTDDCGRASHVYSSEGGHQDFAPTDEEQTQLFKYLSHKFHRVSNERLCSGPGLVNIYKFVTAYPLYNMKESPDLKREQHRGADLAALITKYAMEHGDPMCLRTLDIFIKVYGAIAGNWALATLPKQGLYIVGGIAPKIWKQLGDGRFMKQFLDKGRMSGLMTEIPVHIVLNGNVGLQGVAIYAHRLEMRAQQLTLQREATAALSRGVLPRIMSEVGQA